VNAQPRQRTAARAYRRPTILRFIRPKRWIPAALLVAIGIGIVAWMKSAPAATVTATAVVGLLGWERTQQNQERARFYAAIAELETAWDQLEAATGVATYASELFKAIDECDDVPRHSLRAIRDIEHEINTFDRLPNLAAPDSVTIWNDDQYERVRAAVGEVWKILETCQRGGELAWQVEREVRRVLRPQIAAAFQRWEAEMRRVASVAGHDPAITSVLEHAAPYIRHWWILALCGFRYGFVRTDSFETAKSEMKKIQKFYK
jgi:hypothetical protein